MKKLYFFLLLALSATTSFAQRNVDVQLIHPVLSDTVKIKAGNTTDTTYVAWGIINNGPDTVAVTDTIYLYLKSAGELYYFNNVTIPVGDTIFSIEKFLFASGPASGPAQWCDSIWIKGTAAMPATNGTPSNDQHCEAIYILNQTTGVADLFNGNRNQTVNNLSLFPNPATDNVSFNFDLKGTEGTVTMRDITGRVVFTQNLAKSYGEQKISINTANFSNGIYVVELNTEDSKHVGRIMIQK